MQEQESQASQESTCAQLHPIAFQSGTFKGSQLNWAALTIEADAIYMAFHRFSYYLEGARTILRCDHVPLQKFLGGENTEQQSK